MENIPPDVKNRVKGQNFDVMAASTAGGDQGYFCRVCRASFWGEFAESIRAYEDFRRHEELSEEKEFRSPEALTEEEEFSGSEGLSEEEGSGSDGGFTEEYEGRSEEEGLSGSEEPVTPFFLGEKFLIIELPCGDLFHANCLQGGSSEWRMSWNATCPSCGQTVAPGVPAAVVQEAFEKFAEYVQGLPTT